MTTEGYNFTPEQLKQYRELVQLADVPHGHTAAADTVYARARALNIGPATLDRYAANASMDDRHDAAYVLGLAAASLLHEDAYPSRE
ncbi:hypothetical protein ACUH93_07105 [Dermabacteraceae bacterium P7006]